MNLTPSELRAIYSAVMAYESTSGAAYIGQGEPHSFDLNLLNENPTIDQQLELIDWLEDIVGVSYEPTNPIQGDVNGWEYDWPVLLAALIRMGADPWWEKVSA